MNNKKVLVLPEVFDEVHTGGPLAVVKKMYDLDKLNFDYIKVDGIIERESKKNLKNKITGYILKNSVIKTFHLKYKFFKIKNKIKSYNLNKYDEVISHDSFYSYVIIKNYPKLKVVNVYHGQGNIYNEFTDLLGINEGLLLKNYISNIEKFVYKNSYKVGFPSRGAMDAILKTNNELVNIFNERLNDIIIFYNGVNLDKNNITHNIDIEKNLITDGYNFVSVSSLNSAKGVDRIPSFLGKIKEKGIKFTWTIIGKGDLSEIIKKEIEINNISNESFLFEMGFPKSDILGLFSKSDFYILFHRFSIFDLSTLEAMSYGNIPVLSDVGGNKEVILKNNGILLSENDFSNTDEFIKFIESNSLLELKKCNKKIINDNFLESNFIKKYQEL